MSIERQSIELTTDGSGAASGTIGPFNGRLVAVNYIKDGTVPFTNTGTLTIAGRRGNVLSHAIGSSAFSRSYGQATYGADGVAALYASGGSAVLGDIMLADEVLTVSMASGGDTKKGTIEVLVDRK